MPGRYFGTDGIRDVAGSGLLAPGLVESYGAALGAWLLERGGPGRRVLVGRDTRASGPAIRDQLAAGLLGAGHHLVDGGVLTTPAVQSLCREEGFDLAVVISASHNPAGDNGIKFFGPDGLKLPDAAEGELERRIENGTAPQVGSIPRGAREEDPGAAGRYLDFLLDDCLQGLDLDGMTVVLDCAHGAGSAIAPEALRRLGARIVLRGATPDGTNINDGAGVFSVENLADDVRANGAVLAMALDGDGDRVLLLDEQGCARDGDHVLGLLAEDLLAREALAGRVLVTTVMANMGLLARLRELDARTEVTPVGDRNVAVRMQETGGVLGGEQSGHVIFRDGERWFGDGLYTALRVLEVMRRTGRSLSDLAAGVEKYPQVLINVPVSDKPPVENVPELVSTCSRVERELAEEGRVVLRYSGTEPLLRVMIEGRREDLVRRSAEELAAVARTVLGA